MLQLRVNLPAAYAEKSGEYVELFLNQRIHPEIGLDAGSVDRLPPHFHEGLARTFLDAGLRPSVHLPFQDLLPGARDPLIRDATSRRLKAAVETAKIYDPVHLIGHAVYWHPFYLNNFDQWLNNSLITWREILAHWPDHPPLYLENVFETDPEPMARLMRELDAPDVGICLDVGHWMSFAGGAEKKNLRHWMESLAPWMGHLHLHDNDGTSDHHAGMGQGDFPWPEFFSMLKELGLRPGFTLEPHTMESFNDSKAFIETNPDWFKQLYTI